MFLSIINTGLVFCSQHHLALGSLKVLVELSTIDGSRGVCKMSVVEGSSGIRKVLKAVSF